MFERYLMRDDVAEVLTVDQYAAVVLAYEELRYVATDRASSRITARQAASNTRRLVKAFGARPSTEER